MKRSLYLDLTLPVFADKNLIDRYCTFLKNSLKLVEKNSNLRIYFTLNIFNEYHLQNESFLEAVKIIKSLVESDRAEIILSSTFNIPVSSNQNMFIYDMLYSEYFSGFYLGMPRDFEGDPCIMVKNYHTYFFPGGQLTEPMLDSLKLMGYERVFISNQLSDSFLKYKNIQIIPIELGTEILFKNYVTLESMKDYFSSSNSSIFYLNLFNIFHENSSNIETNFSNLIYLLDRSFNDWGFYEIDDENMKFQETLPTFLMDKMVESMSQRDEIIDVKKELVKHFSHTSINLNDDRDDYFRIPVWSLSSNELVSSQNMFNIKLMALLSEEVSRKNIVLNSHLSRHINDIIDELKVSNYSDNTLIDLISTFQDKINLK